MTNLLVIGSHSDKDFKSCDYVFLSHLVEAQRAHFDNVLIVALTPYVPRFLSPLRRLSARLDGILAKRDFVKGNVKGGHGRVPMTGTAGVGAASVTPVVSVIIPTRNRREWLAQSVASVLGQRGIDLELIVVDDASADGSGEWLESLRDPRLRVIRQTHHQERSAARNAGLAGCGGEFVLFLDDDDQLWPGALVDLCVRLRLHPAAVAAVGARQAWFATQRYKRREPHPRRPLLLEIRDELLFGWCPTAGQAMFRSQAVRDVGGFDPALPTSEDRDLWLKIAELGPVAFHPGIVVTYRQHPDQIWTQQRLERRERVARRAIRSLPPERRRQGLMLRRSRLLLDRAEEDLMAGRTLGGVGSALRAVANTPRILLSPLVGEWTLRWLAGRALRHYLPAREVSSSASTPDAAPGCAGGLAFHPDAPVVHPGLQAHPIIVHRRGGVGNQLFQYAVALQLAAQHGAGVVFTPTDSPLRVGGVQLEEFLGPLPRARWTDLARFLLPPAGTSWRLTRANRRVRRGLGIGRPVWSEPGEIVEQIERPLFGGGVLLNGYFQSLDWIQGALPEIGARLVSRRPAAAVLRDDVIALSFRSGRDFRDANWTLPLAYYERAMVQLDPDRTATLWLIGDEREDLHRLAPHFEHLGWCIEWPGTTGGPQAVDDFWNLTSARGLVLSCSTFAWWAAAAGDYLWGERHRVACPEPWQPQIRDRLRRGHWLAVAYT